MVRPVAKQLIHQTTNTLPHQTTANFCNRKDYSSFFILFQGHLSLDTEIKIHQHYALFNTNMGYLYCITAYQFQKCLAPILSVTFTQISNTLQKWRNVGFGYSRKRFLGMRAHAERVHSHDIKIDLYFANIFVIPSNKLKRF